MGSQPGQSQILPDIDPYRESEGREGAATLLQSLQDIYYLLTSVVTAGDICLTQISVALQSAE